MSAEAPQVCIIGAGPAGLSAALWLHNLGLRVTVLEQAAQAGGMQQLNFLANDWVLGQPGLSGPELAHRFVAHVAGHKEICLSCGRVPAYIARAGHGGFRVGLSDGEILDCAAILLATGTRYRAEETMAQVGGFAVCRERFTFGPHTFRNLDRLAGQRVLIVGGGDNAFENARFLLARGCRVTLAARSALRAQRAMRLAVQAESECRILCPARLRHVAMHGDEIVATLTAGDVRMQEEAYDRVHVLAGYQPNTSFLHECMEPGSLQSLVFDASGYLKADAACRTGCAGFYAAGDVCNVTHPCVVTALAAGAQAARSIELDLRSI